MSTSLYPSILYLASPASTKRSWLYPYGYNHVPTGTGMPPNSDFTAREDKGGLHGKIKKNAHHQQRTGRAGTKPTTNLSEKKESRGSDESDFLRFIIYYGVKSGTPKPMN